MPDVLLFIAMIVVTPIAVCLAFAAGMAVFIYGLWVVSQFGKLMEWLLPSLKDYRSR